MSAVKVPAFGPQPARVLIVGEAPGKDEESHTDAAGNPDPRPFVGKSGQLLTRLLTEAGLNRADIRFANVCPYRPPGNNMELWWPKKGSSGKQVKKNITSSMVQYDGDYFDPRVVAGIEELRSEIRTTQPRVIVPVGNLSLWATTRTSGITKWRSSLLRGNPDYGIPDSVKIIPTIHPAAVLRNWEYKYLVVHDLKRVARWQAYEGYPLIHENFILRPTIQRVRDTLFPLLHRLRNGEQILLATDIETSRRHLACIGIAWSRSDAICIPLLANGVASRSYWSAEEEQEVILLLREVLTHSNARVVGQNWQYDYQYIAKFWGFEVNLFLDIMSEHHVQVAGFPKGLDFQSSMYRDIHIYWKDEGKEMGKGDEYVWWTYNCRDCCATFEIAEVLLNNRNSSSLKRTEYGTPHEIQQRLSTPVARASARGVKVDHKIRNSMAFMLQEDIASSSRWLNQVLGRPFNTNSTPQMRKLFYDELHQEKILDRKTKKPTLGAEELEVYGNRDVLLRPLVGAINHQRSLRNALSVCTQALDADGRLRCQYTIPGTETYRFASSKDPFGFGTNLQNLSSGERAEKGWPLPNLRKWIVPDTNCTIGEFDLPQADARVVAWEAEEPTLIELFADPSRHLHKENADIIYGYVPAKNTWEYYAAKQAVHLSHYGGTAMVLARTLGITVHEADRFQKRYFGVRTRIPKWHNRIQLQLAKCRYVENAYGYRRFYFDYLDGLLKEALAWIPQSTVGIATNLAILNISDDEILRKAGVEFLLQVHDSSVFQWPSYLTAWVKPRLHKHVTVRVPYPNPLVFQAGIKISTKSWGDCEEVEWKEKEAA
jgi:DNA polymerase I-like protein with 3'-5' exonuclease and polymerase domains/uracil-DNA glycosylase